LIYPFIRLSNSDQLYLNVNDVHSTFLNDSILTRTVAFTPEERTALLHAYQLIATRAQLHCQSKQQRYAHLNKYLPSPTINTDGNDRFVRLSTLNDCYRDKIGHWPFIQVFETSSLDEIQMEYKNKMAQQMILGSKQQGGLLNGRIPYLSDVDGQLWIATSTQTHRQMNTDERILLNMMLLYRGYGNDLLTKKKLTFIKSIDDDRENLQIDLLFYRQPKRSSK
jgi:hypothetical protein